MAGDNITTVNRRKVRDSIDFLFYSDLPEVTLSLVRNGKLFRKKILKEEGEDTGIELKPFHIRRCRNKCLFCFVDQLPRGLRRSLYVKDDDFRMSFLYGNYITLTNLSKEDKKRIVEQRLSPLYVSVHSTDDAVRKKLLGSRCDTDIMKELKWLIKHRIRIHAQIVLCPGYNDGDELSRTINDLHKFYPYILSVAVVPAGLTKKRNVKVEPPGKEGAIEALRIISGFQKRFTRKHGDPFVYGADELYIKAGRRFPSLKLYGDLPQIENGVGMIPEFMQRARKTGSIKSVSEKRFLLITGVSFYPYLKEFVDRIGTALNIDLIPVENSFFGESVTVTGLLTGRDIIMKLTDISSSYDLLLLPDVVLREGDDLMLDDVTVRDVQDILKLDIEVIESTPEGLVNAINNN